LQGRWRWAPWRGSNPGADLKGGGAGGSSPPTRGALMEIWGG
jgi:hypothetical protein